MQALILWPKQPAKLPGYAVVRDEEAVVVVYRDEMPIKQPMDGRRQGDTIVNNVGTAVGHRLDMSGLHLSPTAAVHDPKPCYRAFIVVGAADLQSKIGVADLSIHQHLFDAPFEVLGHSRQIGERGQVSRREIEA